MNILFLTSRLPFPATDGLRLRAFNQLRFLSKRHEVFLLSFIESKKELRNKKELEKYCRAITVLLPKWKSLANTAANFFSKKPLQASYYNSKEMQREVEKIVAEKGIDLVFVQLVRIAELAEKIKKPKVLDLVDALSEYYSQLGRLKKGFGKWLFLRESKRLRAFENQQMKKFEALLVTTEHDKSALGNRKIFVLPEGVDCNYFKPSESGDENALLFAGSMNFFPNEDAVVLFAKEILPLVREKVPSVKFFVAGKNPSAKIRAIAKDKSIRITGFVKDVRPFYEKAAVFVCPLRFGAGMKNCVLQAMAMQKAIVATPEAMVGINAIPNKHFLLASSSNEFAKKTIQLLRNEKLRKKLGTNARRFAKKNFSWEKSNRILEKTVEQAIQLFGEKNVI